MQPTAVAVETDTAVHCYLAALEARDPATSQHSWRVAAYAVCLAREMMRGKAHETDEERLATIRTGALLHDIGKLGIGDRLLFKGGRLEPDERQRIEQHVVIGDELLRRYPGLRHAREIVRHHHERWDGAGYPDRLAAFSIPLYARIVHIADVFDALTGARVYRHPVSYSEARMILEGGAGSDFDPVLIKAFAEIPEATWMAAGR